MTGLVYARWNFTAKDPENPASAYRTPTHRALTYRQLPAFAEFEFQTLTGEYGNWLFEVIITVADEQDLELAEAIGADGETEGESGESGLQSGGEANPGGTGGPGGGAGGQPDRESLRRIGGPALDGDGG